MKKIALIHFAYPPHTGGVENLLREHANILVNMDLEVTILTGAGQESNPKIKLTVIPELESVVNFNSSLQEKILDKGEIDRDFYSLADLIENKLTSHLQNSEIVVVHNMLTIVRNLPFVLAFKNYAEKHPEKKYFAWTHDHSYINQFKIKELDKVVNSEKEKELLTSPIKNVKYIVISKTFAKPFMELMKLTADEILVIPDGIDLKKFLEIDEAVWEISKKFNILSSFPVILSPVNILARKNLEYSLDVISNLKKTYPNLLYIISGNPSRHHSTEDYLNHLKTKIQDLDLQKNMLFLTDELKRSLVESEMHDLYDLSDLVFYFSESENFGLPLLEAGLSKIPIFVSDLEVFHEIGHDDVNYIDYKIISADKAADIIKNYLENSKLIKASHSIRKNYNLETILKEKFLPLL